MNSHVTHAHGYCQHHPPEGAELPVWVARSNSIIRMYFSKLGRILMAPSLSGNVAETLLVAVTRAEAHRRTSRLSSRPLMDRSFNPPRSSVLADSKGHQAERQHDAGRRLRDQLQADVTSRTARFRRWKTLSEGACSKEVCGTRRERAGE